MSGADTMRYKAFISYSHAADGALAPALQAALERFSKPWNAIRAFSIFRDATNLSISPGLWPAIEESLHGAEFLLFMASPEATASKWVRKELTYWRENKDPSKLLIVLTAGEIVWDEAEGDFDWARTTAVPDTLLGFFSHEPLYLDFRAMRSEQLTLGNNRFLDLIATLAAPLHGKSKDEIFGEHIRQHRFTMRLARGAIASLAALLLLAGCMAAGFYWQYRLADRRATDLKIEGAYRLLELGSEQINSGNPDRARGSFRKSRDAFREVGLDPRLALYRQLEADMADWPAEQVVGARNGYLISDLHASDDGELIAIIYDVNDIDFEYSESQPQVEMWRASTGKRLGRLRSLPSVEADYTVVGVVPPCDLVLSRPAQPSRPEARHSGADNGPVPSASEGGARPIVERLSLTDGSLSRLSPQDAARFQARQPLMSADDRGRDLTLEPAKATEPVSIPDFFGVDPRDGNDNMGYGANKPDLVYAESRDGTRGMVGTYEGRLAAFATSTGEKLRGPRKKCESAVRAITYIGDSHTALIADHGGGIWRLPEDPPAIRRDLVPAMKASSTELLDLSADGRLLAGIGGGEMFVCETSTGRPLGRWRIEKDMGSILDCRLDSGRKQVHAVSQGGELYSASYETPGATPVARTILAQHGETGADREKIVAWLDVESQRVWAAQNSPDGQQATISWTPLTQPASQPVLFRQVRLSDVQDLHAIARRGEELLLFVGARDVGGSGDSEDLIRFPTGQSPRSSIDTIFESTTEDQGVETVWVLEQVEKVLPTRNPARWFVRTNRGRTVPLAPAGKAGPFGLSDALAIADFSRSDPPVTVAITDGNQTGPQLCIENAARELIYRAPLLMKGRITSCAFSADGLKAAIATQVDGVVFVDLSAYLSEAHNSTGGDQQGTLSLSEPKR